MNTVDLRDGEDELSTPAALTSWLERHRLGKAVAAGPADLHAARRLREALRSLLLENNGDERPQGGGALALSRAAERGRLALRFESAGGVRLEPRARRRRRRPGPARRDRRRAMADGTWSRLKACRADRCGWAFYDHARNRSRRWCSMAVCGNRTKARSYRRRHAA